NHYKTQLAAQGLVGKTAAQTLLSRTSVTGDTANVQLVFTATGNKNGNATTLVNDYASEYVATANAADMAAANALLKVVNAKIATYNQQLNVAEAQKNNGKAQVI